MWVVVYVLFNLQRRTLLLHLHTDHDVQVLCLRSCLLIILAVLIEFWGVGVLHIVACMMAVTLLVHTLGDEVVIELVHHIVLTLQVNHRTRLTFLIDQEEAGDMGILGHLGIIGTKSRCDMHDTGTVLCCHIVTRNHTEGLTLHLHKLIFAVLTCEYLLRMGFRIGLHVVGCILIQLGRGFHPRHQLLIFQTDQLLTCIPANDAIRHKFLALIVFRHLTVVCDCPLRSEIGIQTTLGQDNGDLLTVIGIVGLNSHIVDLRTYAEGCV